MRAFEKHISQMSQQKKFWMLTMYTMTIGLVLNVASNAIILASI